MTEIPELIAFSPFIGHDMVLSNSYLCNYDLKLHHISFKLVQSNYGDLSQKELLMLVFHYNHDYYPNLVIMPRLVQIQARYSSVYITLLTV